MRELKNVVERQVIMARSVNETAGPLMGATENQGSDGTDFQGMTRSVTPGRTSSAVSFGPSWPVRRNISQTAEAIGLTAPVSTKD